MNFQFIDLGGIEDLYVCSDIHGFHQNITRGPSKWTDKSKCRDFDTTFEMTQYIVNKINDRVPANGWLLHLGDWTFGGKDKPAKLREMINCQNIATLIGNHDNVTDEFCKLFSWIGYYNEFWVGKKRVSNFHYPVKSWHDLNKGGYCLSGHIHSLHDDHPGRQLDCGVDMLSRDYAPWHISEIVDYLNSKPICGEGHHASVEKYVS